MSNHGDRQLDHTQGSIDALPPIVDAVAGALDILRRELRTTMALAGQTSVKNLDRDLVFRVD